MKFLVDSINNSKAKWKILYGHHPWRSLGGHGHAWMENKDLEEYFKELVIKTTGKGKSTFDLYMCGHDHNKQYLEIDGRVNVLNTRVDMMRELLQVLQAQAENEHGTNLELIVIWLIVAEVVLQLIGMSIGYLTI